MCQSLVECEISNSYFFFLSFQITEDKHAPNVVSLLLQANSGQEPQSKTTVRSGFHAQYVTLVALMLSDTLNTYESQGSCFLRVNEAGRHLGGFSSVSGTAARSSCTITLSFERAHTLIIQKLLT